MKTQYEVKLDRTETSTIRWMCGFTLKERKKNADLKGHSGAELHIFFLVHLESIYYEIFFYSKIVPNCAVAK